MEQYAIKGGNPLVGEVEIGGAKNAALPILAASVMTDETVYIENMPDVRDTNVLLSAMENIGVIVKRTDRHKVTLNASNISELVVEDENIKKIRASYYLIGALLGKYKHAEVALPGGCDIGCRAIDQHIKGFRALGAEVRIEHGLIKTHAEHLRGSHIYMDVVSVGATINIMMAAVMAEGTTIIENSAKEPHVVDLANFLNSMGANIKGAGTDVIRIKGVSHLHGTEYAVIPDQIEAGTYMVAAAATGGSFNLKLGHNLAEDHAVHIQLTSFAEQVKEKTGGSINIQIIPNGTLGSEADMISQIQAGALDMAKVSASTLGNFSEKYNAFSVPYVFNDQAHYYSYMDSDSAKAVFESTDDQGFRGLTWLDSGARSFYTKATAIRTPADLKGLKIRTMDSQMAIDMMNCLGGSATVMGYSDIYTGMQQGVIDGAENNVTALRDHGDVTKYYCFDEHTRIPDMVVIASSVWNKFSDEQKSIVSECAKTATEEYKDAWKKFEDEVLDKAVNQNGVELVKDVDIAAFQAAVQPIYENLKTSNPTTYAVVEEIRAMA